MKIGMLGLGLMLMLGCGRHVPTVNLDAGPNNPNNPGDAGEPRPGCGPADPVTQDWDQAVLGLRAPNAVLGDFAGTWRASSRWTDSGPNELEIQATFAATGSDLLWQRYPTPEEGITPHQCDTSGTFTVLLTLTLPGRGFEEVVPVTFSTTEYTAGTWQASGRLVEEGRCAEGASCGAHFDLVFNSEDDAGFRAIISFQTGSDTSIYPAHDDRILTFKR